MSIEAVRRLAAVATGLLLAVSLAPSVVACQGEFPTMSFATAVRPSHFVVVATVTSGPVVGEPGTWVLTVDRALRGRPPKRIVIPHPFSGDLCEVNLVRGTQVVLAMTDPASVAYGDTFAWLIGPGGELVDLNLRGMLTDSPNTLDDLTARLAPLPATDTQPVQQDSNTDVPVIVGVSLIGVFLVARRLGQGRAWNAKVVE